MTDDETPQGQEYWWRPYLLGMGTVASFVLSNLAFDYLRSLEVGGWVGGAENLVIAALVLFWLIVYVPRGWHRFRRWQRERRDTKAPPTGTSPRTPLRSYAEQAERWLVALGSEAGGMAATAWFEQEESELLALLRAGHVETGHAETGHGEPGTVDDLAWICAALEAWYVQQRWAEPLLELSQRLTAIGTQARRPDLERLAAIRAATAYRLLGKLDLAADRLRAAADLHVPAGPTEPAIRARLAVEQGLLHLARADSSQGDNRDEEIRMAREEFNNAGLAVPRADLAADTAIQLNRGIVCLYQHDSDGAKDHFQVAEARAAAARDVSAQAHALELLGVAAWQRDNIRQAVLWWQEARDRYAAVNEREGQARCLQHLGSAELVTGDSNLALTLLEDSTALRGGTEGHEVLQHYLARARRSHQPQTEPDRPPHASPSPTGLLRLLRLLRQWWRQR